MFNLAFHMRFPNYNVSHLTRLCSDHAPLWFCFQVDTTKKPGGLIFQKMWVEHPQFLDLVENNWETPIYGSPGHSLAIKLIRLRRTLKYWNWNVFGDLHRKKQELNARIHNLETMLSDRWLDTVHHEWESCKKEFLQVEKWESEMLCQQARMNWIKEGDRNSKFFHAVIKERRKKQVIQIVRPDGDTPSSASEIGARAHDFFADLFSVSPYHMEERLFDSISATVNDVENSEFCKIPTEEEILATIKNMNFNCAPGNDGYTRYFFIAC